MILYKYSCAVCGVNSANVRQEKLHVVLTETYLCEPCWNKFRILSFGLMVGKIESSGTACLLCLTREVNRRPEVHVYVRLLQLLSGPLRSQTFPRTASIDSAVGIPQTLLHLFSFLLRSLFTLLHFLRLPLFHALSSHNTVGGAELEYLEFLRAPLSGICPLSVV